MGALPQSPVRDGGFDPVTVGGLDEARRFDVGTPVYNTAMTAQAIRAALGSSGLHKLELYGAASLSLDDDRSGPNSTAARSLLTSITMAGMFCACDRTCTLWVPYSETLT